MHLIPSNDPRLHEECPPFDFDIGVQVGHLGMFRAPEFSQFLKGKLKFHRGIGLSASQLGIMTSVFVVGNPDDMSSMITLFNPSIVHASEDKIVYEEGCLSFPGMFMKMKRPSKIRVRYAKEDGKIDTELFEGLTARVILHEYDHLQGLTFINRASQYHIDRAKRQKKKLDRLREKRINNG